MYIRDFVAMLLRGLIKHSTKTTVTSQMIIWGGAKGGMGEGLVTHINSRLWAQVVAERVI